MKPLERNALSFSMLLAGFVVWSLAFVVLYGVQATGCRLGWQFIELAGSLTLQRGVLIALFLSFLLAHLGLCFRFLARRSSVTADHPVAFSKRIGLYLAFAALGASVFCFAGVFWLSTC